jgi:FG-GAP-like repeat
MILVWIVAVAALTISLDAQTAPQIRFRAETQKKAAAPKQADFGMVNRVRYRVAAAPGELVVEREPVEAADPQRETSARPKALPGAAWIRESVPAAPGSKALGWGDFDNDGSDELLSGWPAAIWKRAASGKWEKLGAVPSLRKAASVTVADMNGDGLADIVSSDGKTNTVQWNEARLPWVRHVIASGFANQSTVPGDFTGRGRMDVISGDIDNDHKIQLFAAPDWKPTLLRSGIRVIQSLGLDLDGDGDLDYIGAQYRPGLIFWLERPDNPLQQPWTYHLIDDFEKGGVNGVHGLALADLDGDGRPELVAASGWTDGRFPDSIAWFRIPKDPRTAQRWERFILADRDAPGYNHYLAVGDVNGDGRIDVASAAKSGPSGNWFAWWEQPADPTAPWKKHLIAANQAGATNIKIADLNGDGKVDFLASRGHGAGVVWFEAPNWTPHEINSTYLGPHGLAVGDIDGDGDIDFAVCSKDSGILAWFENDGRGHFTEHRIHEDQSTYEVRLVDMNGDGALDILVAGQASRNVVWYENRLGGSKRRK